MSWHCVGPGGGPGRRLGGLKIRSTILCALVRSVALSAAVGVPVPPRALTMLSSRKVTNRGPKTIFEPCTDAVNPTWARDYAEAITVPAVSYVLFPCCAGNPT